VWRVRIWIERESGATKPTESKLLSWTEARRECELWEGRGRRAAVIFDEQAYFDAGGGGVDGPEGWKDGRDVR
jgi:hypothetical protein